jgi:hypothetical protein
MEEVREIPVKIHIIAGSFIPYGSWYGPVQKIDFLNDEIQKGTDEFTSEIKVRFFIMNIRVRYISIPNSLSFGIFGISSYLIHYCYLSQCQKY